MISPPLDTGNYQAVWIEGGRSHRSALQPLTIGPLPSTHFTGPNLTAGQFGIKGTATIKRLLPDGRILIHIAITQPRLFTYHLMASDLSEAALLHTDQDYGPKLLGLREDGSFYLADIPYRFAAKNESGPFELPIEFSTSKPTGMADRGDLGFLLYNSHIWSEPTPLAFINSRSKSLH